MLSILIPTYNYNAFPLVFELQKQCLNCNIKFEILCQDDCSNDFLIENNKINTLKYCSFSSNATNLGRGQNRNYLASKAIFSWLLFLDCDMFPTDSNFIENYLLNIQKNNKPVIFGGILYETKRPEKEQLLRWIYGNKRESLSLKARKEKPHNRALTSNLLIEKGLFINNSFDDSITKYGYEDVCFLAALKAKNIQVCHIENPTFHLDLETSVLFLEKTKTALDNLVFIVDSKIIDHIDSKIVTTYNLLHKLMLAKLTSYIFKKLEFNIRTNLLSENPSLFLFDIYKLGYYCTLKK